MNVTKILKIICALLFGDAVLQYQSTKVHECPSYSVIPVRLVKFARSGGWWKVAPRIFSSALCSLIALLFLLISSVKGPCDFFLPFRSHNISFILFKDALFRHIRQRHSLHNLKRRLENDAIENKIFCCVFFLHCSSSMDVPRTPT